jgi:hypothetical protein
LSVRPRLRLRNGEGEHRGRPVKLRSTGAPGLCTRLFFMSQGSGAGHAEGVSKHRRQASRELVVEADVARAEASLSGGDAGGRHRRSHSRGLILETPEMAEPQQHQPKKLDHGDPNFSSHSPECLRTRFPNYDHYQPRAAGFCLMISAVFMIIAAAIVLAVVVDVYLVPGFRIIPIGWCPLLCRPQSQLQWRVFRRTVALDDLISVGIADLCVLCPIESPSPLFRSKSIIDTLLSIPRCCPGTSFVDCSFVSTS